MYLVLNNHSSFGLKWSQSPPDVAHPVGALFCRQAVIGQQLGQLIMRQGVERVAVASGHGFRRDQRVEDRLFDRFDRGREDFVERRAPFGETLRLDRLRLGIMLPASRRREGDSKIAAGVLADRAGACQPKARAGGDARQLARIERRVGRHDHDD